MYLCINVFIIFVEINLIMEILEVREKVNKAELDILHILNKLSFETSVKPECVELCSLTTNSKTGFTTTSITDVKITFTL